MTIGATTGLGIHTPSLARVLAQTRDDLTDLQAQIASGRRADSFGGLGSGRSLSLALREKLEMLDSFSSGATLIGPRIALAANALTQIQKLASDTKGDADPASYELLSGGKTAAQMSAGLRLSEALDALNVDVNGRYLFSGRDTGARPVEIATLVMQGSGARAGFAQVVDERRQADLGANGLGRLDLAPAAAGAFTLAEDGVHPFGFKLAGAGSTLDGVTVTGPAGGPPPQLDIAVTGEPAAGQTLRVEFALPDGSSRSITLTAVSGAAVSGAAAAPGAFAIGATPEETAENLQAAMGAQVARLADVALVPASAVAASEDFFAIDDANPPRRVDGPPFDSATGLVAGTPDDTVFWYRGEDGQESARQTATARIDSSVAVSYGARANEEGIWRSVAGMAVMASLTFSQADANGAERYQELTGRVRSGLDATGADGGLQAIQVDLASASRSVAAATTRHRETKALLTEMQRGVEGVNTEEAAVELLALQTRLQASYEVTAILSRLSLVNVI